MHVLDEVTIHAVHPLLNVDVEHVYRQPVALERQLELLRANIRGCLLSRVAIRFAKPFDDLYGTAHLLVGDRGQYIALVVEQIALSVALEDGAERPAVPVEIGKLVMACFGV